MSTIKNIIIIVASAILTSLLCKALKSEYLFNYLDNNLIGLLLTLLAINTATLGLIASKIQDIVVEKPQYDFSSTIREMKKSLIEQIVLIIFTVLTLIVKGNKLIDLSDKLIVFDIMLVSILIYSINILWDTGNAVFVVIEELQKTKNGKN